MINSNKKNWKKNQNTPSSTTSRDKQCWRCNKKGTTQKNAEQTKTSSTANSAKPQNMYPKLAKRKRTGRTVRQSQTIRMDPMDLNALSDKWCSRSDVVIEGLPWTRKIVDNILVWVETEEELMERTRMVIPRCKERNITISRKKLELGTELGFAGHIVSQNCIRPDDNKYKAIKEFPTPKNLKGLKSFLGLANQLAADLAHMLAGLRPLLKKGNAWVWEKEHEEEFNNIKNLLTSPTIAKPFDDGKDTILLTDASRLHGLGYPLIQNSRKAELALIQFGLRSLTSTQQRYATIELECLAIVWAIQKYDYYLHGLPHFDIWTDHRPLVVIFDKALAALENARLMRM